MKIELLEISGVEIARKAMRNPMKSWDKATDETDKRLEELLISRGDEESKHLRFIDIYVEVTAPRYWWAEMDTYKVGMDMISESTMHTLMRDGVSEEDFEWVDGPIQFDDSLFKDHPVIIALNLISGAFKFIPNTPEGVDAKNQLLREAKAILPEGFLQKRTLKFNVQTARRIWKQRHDHRLPEWHIFCEFMASLPEVGWMITYQPKKEFKGFEIIDKETGKVVDDETIFMDQDGYLVTYTATTTQPYGNNDDIYSYHYEVDKDKFEVRLK